MNDKLKNEKKLICTDLKNWESLIKKIKSFNFMFIGLYEIIQFHNENL